jgi:hypothetical protein
MASQQRTSGYAEVLRDLLAGAALGGFVGLLVGLAVSEVVAAVLAGLNAVLGGLFCFGADLGKLSNGGRTWRIVGFGGTAAIATVAGIWLRTHGVLAPSLDERLKELTRAGLSADTARNIALYQHAGMDATGRLPVVQSKMNATTSALFSANPETCNHLGASRYGDDAERLDAFARAGGSWEIISRFTRQIEMSERGSLLQAVWSLACDGP